MVSCIGSLDTHSCFFSIYQVKEKTIAARRSAIKTLIFPAANKRDFDELASNVKEGLEVHFVDTYREIYDLAFQSDAGTETSWDDLALQD